MALNIKNSEVEQLAEELARLTKTSKTEVIRQSLLDRRARVGGLVPGPDREERLRQFLKIRVWPTIPRKARKPWSKDDEDAALGYGEWGEPV
jgi:antitoxin VapB